MSHEKYSFYNGYRFGGEGRYVTQEDYLINIQ